MSRCGVVVLLAEHSPDAPELGPAVLMMQRARRIGDPWSGHIAFPGGKVSAHDTTTRAAALRELLEETGIGDTKEHDGEGTLRPICRLSDLITRQHGRLLPMVVSPYVYSIGLPQRPQPGNEAERLWWMPLQLLNAPERQHFITWKLGRLPLRMPAVKLDDANLWGLTLMMAKELFSAANLNWNRP